MADTAIQIADMLIPRVSLPHTPKGASASSSKEPLLPDRPKAGTDARGTGRPYTQATPTDKGKGPVEADAAPRIRGNRSQDESAKTHDNGRSQRERVSFALVLEMLSDGEPVQVAEELGFDAESISSEDLISDGEAVRVVVAGMGQMRAEAGGIELVLAGKRLNTAAPEQALSEGKQVFKAEAAFDNGDSEDASASVTVKVRGASAAEGEPVDASGQARHDVLSAAQQLRTDARTAGEPAAGASAGQAEGASLESDGSLKSGSTDATRSGEANSEQAETQSVEPVSTTTARNAAQNGDTEQSQQGESRASVADAGELRQTADQTGQSTADGDTGRGGEGDASERFQEALRQAAGPDSQPTVTTRAEQSGAPREQQTTAHVDAEPASAAETAQPTTANQPTPQARTPAAQVADSVAETVQGGSVRSGRQITVRLNPPELGSVRITFESDGDQLRGTLEVANSRTMTEIQRELPALMTRLSESGVQLRRMDLDLTDQNSGDSHMPDFADSETGEEHRDGSQSAPATQDDIDGETPAEPVATTPPDSARIDDDAINVWI